MDALDDAEIHTVVVQAGAQTGKTVTAYGWLARSVCCDPGPALVCYPSEDLARSNSQTRIQPLFEDSPATAAILPNDLKTEWTNMQYRLKTCVVNFVGSNSPASLASRPCRYVLGDEVSKWPQQTGEESDPVNLVRQRQKTFEHNSKAFFLSTPTVQDDAILRLYATGDQRKYHVPCPYCHGWHVLKWANIKFDATQEIDKAAAGARYECEACKTVWTDRDKQTAVAVGEWRATKTAADPGVASFHLPSFLAPWVKWEGLVRKFLRTKNNPVELQDFVNSELAEPFIQADTSIRAEVLAAREADYTPETVKPFDLPQFAESFGAKQRMTFGGVDVQQEEFVVVLREFTIDGESALVYKGRVATFAGLDALMTQYQVEAVCIDSRYRTDDVYAAATTYSGIWPCKGVGEFRVPGLWEAQTRNLDEGRRDAKSGRTIGVLMFDSNALHTILADRIHRAQYAPAWFLYRGASGDAQYVREMTAQYRHEGRWVNPTKRDDHYWDAEALAILAADKAGYKPTMLADETTEEAQCAAANVGL
jgi:phage terminase large subunit GpA-like protein